MSGSRAAARSEIGTRGRSGSQGLAARLFAPVMGFALALAAVGGLAACGGGSSAATSGTGAGTGAGNNPASVAASGSSSAVTPTTSATGGKGSGFGAGLNSILPSAGSTAVTGGPSGSAGTVVGSPSPQPAATKTTTVSSSVMFSSPSKNVACDMESDPVYTRCDIAQRNWATPPRPASCDLDYGNGLFLDKSTAGISCAGDTLLGQTRILGYGQAIRLGSQVCASSAAGMRCTNLANGHGFVLAKEGYQIF